MVYQVPGGGLVRCYLISAAEGLLVVDPGSVGVAEAVKKLIRASPGWKMEDVRGIVATHFHIDHIGGIGRLLRACSDETVVFFQERVKNYLRGERNIPRMRNWISAFLPAALKSLRYCRRPSQLLVESLAGIPLPGFGVRFQPPLPLERIRLLCADGAQSCGIGFGNWEVIATPGHTSDSLSLYNEKEGVLICGDLILNLNNDGGHLNTFCESRAEIEETFRRLCGSISPRTIYPAHGEKICAEGNALLAVKNI